MILIIIYCGNENYLIGTSSWQSLLCCCYLSHTKGIIIFQSCWSVYQVAYISIQGYNMGNHHRGRLKKNTDYYQNKGKSKQQGQDQEGSILMVGKSYRRRPRRLDHNY